MSKKCPFCQSELPDEAHYCLNCCSSLSTAPDVAASLAKVKKYRRTADSAVHDLYVKYNLTFSKFIHNPKNKKAFPIAIISFATVFLCLLVSAASHSVNIETVTETRLVTEKNGEAVTDENGENVYEVVEVTTEQSFLESLFGGSKSVEGTSDGSSGSVLGKLFGSDDSTATTVASPNSSTNETSNKTQNSKTETTAYSTTKVQSSDTDNAENSSTQSSDGFSYTEGTDGIKITGYNGSASNIIVPAYIDGKRVVGLGENAFSNNSSIKSITFEDADTGDHKFFLPYMTCAFSNLPNLTKVTFPLETSSSTLYKDYTLSLSGAANVFEYLFSGCPKLEGVYFGKSLTGDAYLTQIDGVVLTKSYTSSGKTVLYYPPGKKDASYTTPSGVDCIHENAIRDNPYLETLTFSSEVKSVSGENFLGCKKLKAFIAVSGNNYISTQNGVLYSGSVTINGTAYTGVCYPPGKTDTEFTFRDDINIVLTDNCFYGNPYIQTVRLPHKSYVYAYGISKSGEYKPSSLKKIYMTSDSASNGSNEYEIVRAG